MSRDQPRCVIERNLRHVEFSRRCEPLASYTELVHCNRHVNHPLLIGTSRTYLSCIGESSAAGQPADYARPTTDRSINNRVLQFHFPPSSAPFPDLFHRSAGPTSLGYTDYSLHLCETHAYRIPVIFTGSIGNNSTRFYSGSRRSREIIAVRYESGPHSLRIFERIINYRDNCVKAASPAYTIEFLPKLIPLRNVHGRDTR